MKRLGLILVAAVAACATTDPPEQEMAAARAMVAQARPMASDAPTELAAAQGKLERAELAMQRGHYEHARLLAEQAEADARLAWTTAENTRLQRALQAERITR
jgi:hypothetical protein